VAAIGITVEAAEYDAWYDTPRGRWIGETEFRLLSHQVSLKAGNNVLDVGCGTGWFTRRLARQPGPNVTGLDVDARALAFARSRDVLSNYVLGDALQLPFEDESFDLVISIAALCFIRNWPAALSEIVRVCRGRFAIGLLNRHSLLWRQKGQDGGAGAYRGAHWHTAREVRGVLGTLPVHHVSMKYAIFLPSGSAAAQLLERCVPASLPFGSFLLVVGSKRH
jgi:SAM-dependent methyltransferase